MTSCKIFTASFKLSSSAAASITYRMPCCPSKYLFQKGLITSEPPSSLIST
ncbi:hypothetical protein X975_04828, partial [Stegodyphus mimosarum]